MDMNGAAIRLLWTDACTVLEYREYTAANGATKHTEETVLEDEPCKLSFSRLAAVNQTDSAAVTVQAVKLFIDQGLVIAPGSKIVVRRDGRVFEYAQSGLAGVFRDHQEIPLVPFGGYA